MPFTSGQLIFALSFVIVFAIFLVLAYRKDIKLHRKNYKGRDMGTRIFCEFYNFSIYRKRVAKKLTVFLPTPQKCAVSQHFTVIHR